MPTIFSRVLLFLSAYSPLFIIFTIQNSHQYGYWAFIPVGVGLVATLWLWLFLRWIRGTAPRTIEVQAVQRKDSEVMAYMFTYIFPFLGLKFDEIANAASLGIFFLVLMVLHVSANMVHINPVLNLIGYHVYEISGESEATYTLISRRSRLTRGTHLDAVMIGDDLFMEKR